MKKEPDKHVELRRLAHEVATKAPKTYSPLLLVRLRREINKHLPARSSTG